ncbi:MAG: M16 family metallopeptidase, partial [Tannerellaceae bacterium]
MSLRQKFMLTLLLCVSFGVFAQQQQPQPLPIDPKVRYGVLDNGLTYYIRHNELPKDRADFYIAQKVGSILEEDSQAGLAHFLEHMAFNGTTNFPDKTMMNYLESIGVKFGENLNAYTGFDETVYMVLNVPTTRNSIIDSCLLVLHDWSGFITLDPKEIDKERGVIREEWRTRGNAQMRIWEQMFPQIYPGSKYANRLPIGSIDVINNFKPQEIRDYYNTWYRPDQQAIVVVGDVNVDKVEADIKKMFADIPKRTNEKERVYFPVPDNDEPIVAISKDKEATSTSINLFFKHDPLPDAIKSTAAGLVVDYMKSVAATMMNERFNEMRQKANAPFLYAGASDGEYFVSKTKDAWSVFAACKETGIDQALTAITEETERMKRYGFTPSEYDRARINVLKMYETQYNEREKQKNNRYAQEYVTHFTSGGYIPGIETEYTLINQVAPKITVEDVNEFLKQIITNKNIVISLTAPEKVGVTLPTKADL